MSWKLHISCPTQGEQLASHLFAHSHKHRLLFINGVRVMVSLGYSWLWWSAHELLKKLILGANKRRRAADIQNIIITANNSRPKLAPLMNPLDHQIDMIDSLKLICALLIVTLCQLRCDIIELDFSSSILASPRQAD